MKLKAIALASVVGVPPSAIQDIFAKQPLLLNLSARALVAKTRALKQMLGYSDLQLWQVVFTKPGVLLFASDKLAAKWDTLQQLAGEARGGGLVVGVGASLQGKGVQGDERTHGSLVAGPSGRGSSSWQASCISQNLPLLPQQWLLTRALIVPCCITQEPTCVGWLSCSSSAPPPWCSC